MRTLLARLRAGRLLLAAGLAVILVPVAIALAGPVGTNSGFEDDDGNLAPIRLGSTSTGTALPR